MLRSALDVADRLADVRRRSADGGHHLALGSARSASACNALAVRQRSSPGGQGKSCSRAAGCLLSDVVGTSPSAIRLAEHRVQFGVGPELPELLRTAAGDRDLCGPLEGSLPCGHVDDGEAATQLLALRVRAVGDRTVGAKMLGLWKSIPPAKMYTPALMASWHTACAALATAGPSRRGCGPSRRQGMRSGTASSHASLSRRPPLAALLTCATNASLRIDALPEKSHGPPPLSDRERRVTLVAEIIAAATDHQWPNRTLYAADEPCPAGALGTSARSELLVTPKLGVVVTCHLAAVAPGTPDAWPSWTAVRRTR